MDSLMDEIGMLRGVVIRGRRNPLHHGLRDRLKLARQEAGIAPARLSVDAGLSVDTVLRIEDQGRVPLLDTIEKLARVLKVSPCFLAYGVQAPCVASDVLLCSSVGRRLTVAREARGLSGKALARAAGMAGATALYIEAGRTMPTVATCEKLAKALGVDPCWLAYGQGSAPDLPDRADQ